MRVILFTMLIILVALSPMLAQELNDYVEAVRGDTLVIRDFFDMNEDATILENVFALDDAAPVGRVYELKVNGYYPLASNLTTPADRAVIIAGADYTRMVVNHSPDLPPVICGFNGNSGGHLTARSGPQQE